MRTRRHEGYDLRTASLDCEGVVSPIAEVFQRLDLLPQLIGRVPTTDSARRIGRITTISLSCFPAACNLRCRMGAAPDEMPTSSPSSSGRRRAMTMASSFETCTISSINSDLQHARNK